MAVYLTQKTKLLIHEGLANAWIIRMHREINYFIYIDIINTWNYNVIVTSKIEELRTASRFFKPIF